MKKPLVALGAVAAGALAIRLWAGAGSDDGAASDPSLLLNRIWVDHMPRGEKDTVNVFAAVTRQAMGVFQAASRWKGSYEVFQYEAHEGELRVVFPHTGEKQRVRARAWTCNEHGMEFCLQLSGSSRGVKRYYSRKGFEIGASASADDARARVESLLGAPLTASP
jgi:hypothetical protein